MAKDDFDLDNFDLDDIDLGGLDDLSTDPLADDREPVTKFTTSFLEGVKETATDTDFLKKTAKRALPEGYGKAADLAEEASTTVQGLYDVAKEELAPAVKQVRKMVTSALPDEKPGFLPQSVYDKLKGMRDRDREDEEWDKFRSQGQDNEVAIEMAKIFGEQLTEQQERRSDEEDVKDAQESIVQRKTTDATLEQLIATRTGIERLVGYQDSVLAKFQKKSLELQYRQYFTARDLLEYTKASGLETKTRLDNIIKNTGLPDAQKIRLFETSEQQTRERLVGWTHDKVGDFIGGYTGQLAEKVRGRLKQEVANLSSIFGSIVNGQEIMEGSGVKVDGASMAGGVAGGWVTERLGEWLSENAAPHLEKDPTLREGSSRLSYIAKNYPELLNEFAKSQSDGKMGWMMNFIKSMLPTFNLNEEIGQRYIDVATQPASMTNSTIKSIEEIIPGHLSNIHHELRMMRTGDENIERVVYNIDREEFTEASVRRNDVKNRLISDMNREGGQERLNSAMEMVVGDRKISDEAKHALRELLMRDATRGYAYSPARYAEGQNFPPSMNAEIRAELTRFFRETMEETKSVDAETRAGARARIDRAADEVKAARTAFGDPVEDMLRYYKLNEREVMRELGFIQRDGLNDKIDYNAILRMQLEGSGDQEAGPFDPSSGGGRWTPPQPPAPTSGGVEKEHRRVEMVNWSQTLTEPIVGGLDKLNMTFREFGDNLAIATGQQDSLTQQAMTNAHLAHIITIMESGNFGGGGPSVDGGSSWWDHANPMNYVPSAKKMLGNMLGGVSRFYGGMFKGAGSVLKGAGDMAGSTLGFGRDLLGRGMSKVGDIYVKGESEPRLLYSKLQMGLYRDKLTGKVIKSLKDIKGPIVDEAGNVVLNLQDIKTGLMDRFNKPILTNLFSKIANFYGAMFTLPTTLLNMTTGGLKRGYQALNRPVDIYVAGEEEPRLLAHIMEMGGYFSKNTLKAIKSWRDIDGPIVDADGNVVLAAKDIRRGLVGSDGKPLRGLADRAIGLAKRVASVPMTVLNMGIDTVKGIAGGIGQFFQGMSFPEFAASSQEQTTVLKDIYALLDERMDKPLRAGSWQERLSKAAIEGKAEKEEPTNPGAGHRNIFGMAGDAMKSLYDRFNPFGGEDGLDVGDAMDAYDALDDNSRRRSRKRRIRPGGKKTPGPKKMSKMAKVGRFAGKTAKGAGKVAKGLGKGAGTALRVAGWVGRGALMLGSGLGAVLTSPVTLAVGATALAAYGGYKLYKHLNKPNNLLSHYRLLQYGVHPSDEEQVAAIGKLEERLINEVKLGGQPTLSSAVMPGVLLDIFGIDYEDEDTLDRWVVWFQQRFKPVFMSHLAVLDQLGGSVKLSEVDDKLPKRKWKEYVSKTSFSSGNDSPYDIIVSPFDEEYTTVTLADINAAKEKILEAAESAKEGDEKVDVVKSSSTVSSVTSAGIIGMKPPRTEGAKVASTNTASTPNQRANPIAMTGTVVEFDQLRDRRLSALTAIRLKTYGLMRLNADHVRALMELERLVLANIRYSSRGIASFDGDWETYLQKTEHYFNVGSSEDAEMNWMSWFTGRFVPTLLAAATAARRADPTVPFDQVESRLSAEKQLEVAIATIAARIDEDSNPVWRHDISPFQDLLRLGTDPTITDGNVAAIREKLGEAVVAETAVDAGKQRQKSQSFNAQVDFNESPSPLRSTVNQFGGRQNMSTFGARDYGARNGSSFATMMESGTPISHPGNGTGGDVNSLPMSNGDGSWEAHKDLILAASKMAGVDPKLMATMASIESGFRASVKASTSSATGLYQFITGTWNDMLKKYGSKYGISPNASRSDPRANALMGAEFLKENMRYLEKNLGRPITDTDLYVAHFMGAGGAHQLLKGSPSDNAVALNPKAAAANRNIFYTGGQPNTLAEVYNVLNQKVKSHSSKFSNLSAQVPTVAANDDNVNGETTGDVSAADGTTVTTTNTEGSKPTPPPLLAVTAPVVSESPSAPTVAAPTAGSVPSMTNAFQEPAVAAAAAVERRKTDAMREASRVEVQTMEKDREVFSSYGQMLEVLNQSLNVQMSMDTHLANISQAVSGVGNSTTTTPPSEKPAMQQAAGRRPVVHESKQAPINLRRVG